MKLTQRSQEKLRDGFLSASIKNVGEGKALVNGVVLFPGEAKGYPFVGKGYKKITYDPGSLDLKNNANYLIPIYDFRRNRKHFKSPSTR